MSCYGDTLAFTDRGELIPAGRQTMTFTEAQAPDVTPLPAPEEEALKSVFEPGPLPLILGAAALLYFA